VELAPLFDLFNAGRHLEAEQKAGELLTRNPNAGFVWKVLGLCLWAQRKQAVYALQQATRLCPDDAEGHSNLANVLLETGQLDDAVRSCRRALAIDPFLAEAHCNLGDALRDLGRADEAIVSYRRALEIQPRLAIVHNNLGNALCGLGRVDEAMVSYRRALEIQPSFATAHNNLGNAALQLGQIREAAASYRCALQIRHDYAEAHSNLGNAQRILGQCDEAAESCRRAIQIRGDFAEAHNNLGNAYRALQQLPQALDCYRRAIEIEADYALAHVNAGDTLLELGQVQEAASSYRRAAEIKPDYAEAHGKLGHVLRQLWQQSESAASSRRALAIDPGYAEAHNNLGCALLDLVHLAEAEASFRQVLKLEPDYAEAHSNLAYTLRLAHHAAEAESHCRKALELNPDLTAAVALLAELHADKGEFEEAEQLYRRAISIDPELPMAWAGIPHLRKMTRGDSAWMSEAQRIADKHPPPRQEIILRCALGKYFDDVKDFEQAFIHYKRANELAKLHRPTYAQYDRAAQQRRIDNIIRLYDQAWLSRAHRNSNPSLRPVFVVGLRRTGTTLVQQILASHPAVVSAGGQGYWDVASLEHESCLADDNGNESPVGKLALDYLRLLEKFSTDAPRVVDQRTTNFMCLGLIHAALPNARIIHMRRDPIDTCLSNYFLAFGVANDLQDLAHYYTEYSRLMDHWRATLPKDCMLEVRYEELVEDQETWSRRMIEFIGLPWNARCIDFQRAQHPVITASRWQVRQKMTNASIERWRNYASCIEPLLCAMHVTRSRPQL